MYKGIVNSSSKTVGNGVSIFTYKVLDNEINQSNIYFSVPYNGMDPIEVADSAHFDGMLYSLYDIYKMQRMCLTKVFRVIIKKSFGYSKITIKKTRFYKDYKNIVDYGYKDL